MEGLVILGAVIGLYFLPTIIAATRKVPSGGSVLVINLFLGWTLIGWVVALAMAARDVPQAHLEQLEVRRQAWLLEQQQKRDQKMLAELDRRQKRELTVAKPKPSWWR